MTNKAVTWDGVRYICTPVIDVEPHPAALVPYSQNDPRWRNQVYAHSLTFAQAGCLVCCVTMAVSVAYPETILPPEVAQNMKRAGCFVGDYLSRPSRIPDAYPRLAWDGAVHYRDKPADMEFIRSELARYGYVIAEVKFNPYGGTIESGNQHFVVISELTADGDALIADPWDGEFKLLSKSRYHGTDWTTARTITGLRLVHLAEMSTNLMTTGNK
jgi:hypothetical protein